MFVFRSMYPPIAQRTTAIAIVIKLFSVENPFIANTDRTITKINEIKNKKK